MPNLNIKKVKKNIINAMNIKGYKQKDISRITGMPQANVSRALDLKQKHMFTVEQLYLLAEDFDISIDQLLGRKNSYPNYSASEICSILTYLFEHNFLSHFTHSAKTTVTELENQLVTDDVIPVPVQVEKEIEYKAFFFPNNWVTDWPINDPDEVEYFPYINDNYIINNFLNKYLQIFPLFKDRILPEDAYRYAVNGYLDKIRTDERKYLIEIGDDIPDFLLDDEKSDE